MEIRALEIHDDVAFARYHEIGWRAEKEDGRDWTSMWTLAEMRSAFHAPTDDERLEGWCAYEGARMVGAAFIAFSLADNVDKVYAMAFVEPELRRRGVGSALADKIAERTAADGRRHVLGETSYPFEDREAAPALLWARKNGFTVAHVEVHRKLALPVESALLEQIVEESRPHHGGYVLRTFLDEMPDELLASYCWLNNQLVLEAPMGELDYEEEKITPEIWRAKRARDASIGRRLLTTVAVHDGSVVALSDLNVPSEPPQANQWATLVAPEHRGHRLGQAVKATNLLALQREAPDRTEVHTQNAEVNPQMVAINDRLGFVPVAVVPGLKRTL